MKENKIFEKRLLSFFKKTKLMKMLLMKLVTLL
jgi:hypothetical protein